MSAAALVAYLVWRVGWTMPAGGTGQPVAWALVAFEALPLVGLVTKTVMLWNIDTGAPDPVRPGWNEQRMVVFIATYNEPAEVIAPTIAAACELDPVHETWVLDDGGRPWVADLCAELGARYVARPTHEHAKAGNLNHALELLAQEERSGVGGADLVAVLDCDHVPLPTFLTSTARWFEDESIALVQGPQAFYNSGAFDDDGSSGEQGLFFNVLMPARDHAGAGPFWCGSTAVLRVRALEEIGGVATETITEDLHTTLKLVRAGWRTVYHHQTLAVGVAPRTPDQYLLQRRRWGLGAMQILAHEGVFRARRWMSWRTYAEYLNGTLWWLEGIATLVAFAVPAAVMLTGARTSTADPAVFAAAFGSMFALRLWGARRLLRKQIHWPTAFALRILRVPVGVACLWWLASRRALTFEVTPKGAADERQVGEAPHILRVLMATVAVVLAYTGMALAGVMPWHPGFRSALASGLWLVLAAGVLLLGARRIRSAAYATSRREAHRVVVSAPVTIGSVSGDLMDVSVGGARVRVPAGSVSAAGALWLGLPGAEPIAMEVVWVRPLTVDQNQVSLRAAAGDWRALGVMSRWLFHTPAGVVPGLPDGVPVVAAV